MTAIMAGDLWASMRVGVGLYKSRRDALISQGVPEGEARERAARATWALVEEAQQSDRPENTPDVLRRHGFYAKQMYKFQSANVLQFSHEFTALMQWRRAQGSNRTRAKRKFINAVIAKVGIDVKYKQTYISGIPSEEYFAAIEAGIDINTIRPSNAAAEKEEVEQAAEEAEAADKEKAEAGSETDETAKV